MKKLAALLSAATILVLPAVGMTADQQPAPRADEGKIVAETIMAENAIVTEIDPAKRTVTLRLPNGREETLVVDQSVRNLGQVQVGDTVRTRYREAVSIKINKVKVPPGVNVETTVRPDEKSVKPSGTASLKATTTATIEKIYPDGKKVTLKTPDGTTADVEVRDPENRAKIKRGEVKAGDQIQITYYRAVAISVEKTAPK